MAASIWGYNVYSESGGYWTGWSSSNPYDQIELGPKDKVLYRIDTNIGSSTTITGITIVTPCSAQKLITYFCALFDEDLSSNRYASVIAHTSSSGSSSQKTFSFQDLSLVGNQRLYIEVQNFTSATASSDYNCVVQAGSVNISTTLPALTITGISPSTVIGGNSATVNFGGRDSQTLTLTLYANGSYLTSKVGINSNSTTIPTNSSWVDTYGSGSNLTVTATVSDNNGRSASSNFTVRKAQAIVPSITTPRSGTYEGGESIAFAWTISGGDGTASSYTLQYSTDNANWLSLASVSGSNTTWSSSAAKFPPGTVYWRIKCTNSYGVDSNWVSANFTVRYSATTHVEPLNSPTGGNINAANPVTFSAKLVTDGTPYTAFTMASATFYWRARTTDNYTSVQMTPSGANASVTISGGTFPAGSIYWYISGTDNAGTTTETSVYTISTLASDIDAQPVSPVNTVEISNDDIEFVWRFASTSGDPQNGAELQYSLDGSTWEQLASAQGTATSVIVSANTFHAGTVYWRVRAFNGVGDSGPWSSAAQFVAYGAPEAPSVTVDAVPFATIRWQSVGQASFEVEVDGTVYGPFLGDEKFYNLYDYLEDGSHKARVRILGDAGLWSLWGETLFDITNVPETTLTLRAKTDVDTELTWVGGSSNYYVYRDRKLIARTNKHSFADRTVLGVHEYHVIERLASGNYNASNLLTRTMEVEFMHIAALEGGSWVEILHTLKGSSDPSYTYNAETESVHQDNSEFPVVSIGPYLDESASYSAVFLYTEPDEHRHFRALFRKPVILKTTDGVVMIGVLNAWERSPKTSRAKQYYTAYTFNLQRIDWEDFIDDST